MTVFLEEVFPTRDIAGVACFSSEIAEPDERQDFNTTLTQ
jgi:hypothetical protein